MAEGELLLYRRTPDGGRESTPLRLMLRAGKMPVTSELLRDAMASVYSDAGYEMELTGLPLPVGTRVRVLLEGEAIASGAVPLDVKPGTPVPLPLVAGNVRYVTPSDGSALSVPAPFADVIGLACLEVEITLPEQPNLAPDYQSPPFMAYLPPLRVMIPAGPAADNISRMASYVCSHYESFMAIGKRTPESSAADAEGRPREVDPVERRLAGLENLLHVFERQFPFFRANARCKLEERWESGPVERLREFSARTVAWIVEHPEELMPSASADPRPALRFAGRNWVPRHTLVRTSARSRDIYEHRVIAGFLRGLEDEVSPEAARIRLILSRMPDEHEASVDGRYRSSASAIFELPAKRLENALVRLEALRKRIRRACLSYAEALEVKDPRPVWPAKATNIFLGIAPYRMLFEAMTAWRAEPRLRLAEEQMLLTCFERSRLYEYFCLMRLIEGLRNLGWRCTEARRWYYEAPGLGVDRAPGANTFLLAPEDDAGDVRSMRVFYQPVISAGAFAGENDIGLVRVTNISLAKELEESVSGMQLKTVTNPYYTPDYLVELRTGSARHWFIIDAKYSKLRTVLLGQTATLVWKYLFSIRPTGESARVEGLWLLCGNEIAPADGAPRQRSLSPFVEDSPGLACGPEFRLEAWDSEGVGSSLFAAIERLARAG